MIKIKKEKHKKILENGLFKDLMGSNLHIQNILENKMDGELFVDKDDTPSTGVLIWRTEGATILYLCGDPNNQAFNRWLNTILPEGHFFGLWYDSPKWEPQFQTILKDKFARKALRRYYRYTDSMPDTNIIDSELNAQNFNVAEVNAEIFTKDLENNEGLKESILDEWNSLEQYFDLAFGYCIIDSAQNKIVSWSLIDYVSGSKCEIGVNTDFHYRKQGLGYKIVSIMVKRCLEAGFKEIGWHCWDNNIGSYKIAEKVGFNLMKTYPIYLNHWAAENITDMTKEEFIDFAKSYEEEFLVTKPKTGFPYIVVSKAWALGGDPINSYKNLHLAIDIGWLESIDHLRKIWPEFFWNSPHKEDPERELLMKRLALN